MVCLCLLNIKCQKTNLFLSEKINYQIGRLYNVMLSLHNVYLRIAKSDSMELMLGVHWQHHHTMSDTLAVPATYCSPDRTGHVSLGMVGFVDDSNGQTKAFLDTEDYSTTPWNIQRSLRHNAQAWTNLLGVSGGAFELSKCSVHVAAWDFTVQGAPMLRTDNDRFSNITVVDPTSGTENRLQYLSPYTAHKTLGHHKEPAGS